MDQIEVKICGLTTEDAINACIQYQADYIGFIFYPPSKRNISPEHAKKLAATIPPHIKKVAVTVDASTERFDHILQHFKADYLQLHGNESLKQTEEIKQHTKLPIIKACSISSHDDVIQAVNYEPIADMLLFDTKPPKTGNFLPGGNNLSFDWELLKNRQFNKKWLLSGGLNSENIEKALTITNAPGIDLSSSVEKEPGTKDPKKIEILLKKVKNL